MTPAALLLLQDATAIAQAVRRGECSALALTEACLDRIAATDPMVNAFTAVTARRALDCASTLDARLSQGSADPVCDLPLLGVPFAVKNLFDVQGLATLAGSKIERSAPPATRDALLVERLQAAGAVLVGALNMDEYAYGFTTENSHHGATRNPHDPDRTAGGSSGGSAAAVAAGQVPVTLGSDTNGSIRVPSSLCGVFGLKPSYGRLPRTRTYPFVASLDHLGPFARSARDLARVYDALQGHDAYDPACVRRGVEPATPALQRGIDGLRIGILGGYFEHRAGADARAAVAAAAKALGTDRTVELAGAELARAAAFVITNAEGAQLHLADLKTRAADFEPLSRDRFLAGALLPAAWLLQAQRVRRRVAIEAAALFEEFDILLAPATPCVAPPLGTEWIDIGGERLPARPSLGLLTQPLSCLGLPVCAVPVRRGGTAAAGDGRAALPLGVQVVAAPWREDLALRVAQALETLGVARAPVATPAPLAPPASA